MKTFIQMCNQNNEQGATTKVNDNINDMTVDELYKLMEQQKNHLRFMKEIDALTPNEKDETVSKIRKLKNVITAKVGMNGSNNSNNISYESSKSYYAL